MAMRQTDPLRGEFELIDRLFAPLARGLAGAFELKDDVAALPPRAGHEVVLKTDSTIEGVHFLSGDPPGSVAQKALRRALSDLAAKGAEPQAYLLAIAFPETTDNFWVERFVDGLARDQEQFGVALAGGETTRTPGPLAVTVTLMGWVPEGQLVRRNGAKAGDEIWITGTIGDAAGGLALLRGEADATNSSLRERLVARFRVPEPRLAFGLALRGLANAAIDISDGLLADLGHIADVSQVKIEIDAASVPISPELHALWGDGQQTVLRAASAGDDYEIAFSAPPAAPEAIRSAAARLQTPVTRIGCVVEGAAAVSLHDSAGREIPVPRKGYMHF
ncbi:MAG TPA: thiamine-phosphate kinase [Rhizomicrobium sp.]|jgi:thiamine-monophosphate kinase|nr:thiamine-phosphate kinase [Rhizomicrobium sp.]